MILCPTVAQQNGASISLSYMDTSSPSATSMKNDKNDNPRLVMLHPEVIIDLAHLNGIIPYARAISRSTENYFVFHMQLAGKFLT